jgi:hypothetical protein
MSNSAMENLALAGTDSKETVARTVKIVLGAWLAVVFALAALGAFERPVGSLPLPVAAGVVVPLIVFAIALRASAAFRAFVLGLDLRLIVALQAWRFAGFGFIALYESCAAGPVRLAGGAGRHGDRGRRAVARGVPGADARGSEE